jgi:hypothetical protein
MNTIEPDLIISNYLDLKRTKCTLQELHNIKNKLESAIPDIYIDMSRKAIFTVLENYSNLFYWSRGTINLVENNYNSEYIEIVFNLRIPLTIKREFLNIVKGK